MARGALSYGRLRARIPQAKARGVSGTERKELFALATKVLKNDINCHSKTNLERRLWEMKPLFQCDTLVWVLYEICHQQPGVDLNSAWDTIQQAFECHSELIAPRQAIHVAVGRLTLKAWNTAQRSLQRIPSPEPGFISSLKISFQSARGIPCNTTTSYIPWGYAHNGPYFSGLSIM